MRSSLGSALFLAGILAQVISKLWTAARPLVSSDLNTIQALTLNLGSLKYITKFTQNYYINFLTIG